MNKHSKWRKGDLNTITSKIAYYSRLVDYQQKDSIVYVKFMVWHPLFWIFCVFLFFIGGVNELMENKDVCDWRFRDQNKMEEKNE